MNSRGDLFDMRGVIGTDHIHTHVVNPDRPSSYQLHSIRERHGAVGDVDGDFDFLPLSISLDKTLRCTRAKAIAKCDRHPVDVVRTDPKTRALSHLIARRCGKYITVRTPCRGHQTAPTDSSNGRGSRVPLPRRSDVERYENPPERLSPSGGYRQSVNIMVPQYYFASATHFNEASHRSCPRCIKVSSLWRKAAASLPIPASSITTWHRAPLGSRYQE